jgi:hypothetical protein
MTTTKMKKTITAPRSSKAKLLSATMDMRIASDQEQLVMIVIQEQLVMSVISMTIRCESVVA